MMRKWLFATAMLLPGAAVALGLGKLDLNSALNEPFDARVRLLSASVEELDSLKAGLASPEAFERAGLQFSFALSKLKFEIREMEEGPDYIRVYSSEPIREPFLNFLIEVNWNQGRLYREYTVLLDPPTYDPNRKMSAAAPAPVQMQEPYGAVQAIEDNQVSYNLDYTQPAAPVSTPSIRYTGGDYGPTSTGDTLWSIASAMRPDSSVSVQQMMIALLRANPEAFIGNNINGLKRGQILSMPDAADITKVSKSEAIELAKSQNNLWNDIRSGMAEAVTDRPESAGVSGSETDTATMTEAPMVEGDAELRLIAPKTSGEGIDEAVTEPGMDAETQQLLALANETISALELENTELKDKLVESESIIEDLKRLIQLKEDELAALQEQIASAAAMEEEAAEEEMPAEEEVMEASEAMQEDTEAAGVEEEGVSETDEGAPEGSMDEEKMAAEEAGAPADAGIMGMVNQYLGPVIEIVKSNLVVIGGVAGGIIVLLLGFAAYQKRQSHKAETLDIPESTFPDFEEVTEAAEDVGAESMMDISESEIATEIPEDEAKEEEDKTPTPQAPEVEEAVDDATQIVSPPSEETAAEAPPEEEEEDPLAEVNVFMAFDQFDQAVEFVKNAIEGDPDNLDFHTRLLEVYYAASDKKSYEEHAKVLHDKVNGEGPHWDMAVTMWSDLSPNRALFEEGAEEEEEAPAETGGGVMDLTTGEDVPVDKAESGGLDFDIGSDDEGVLDVTTGAEMEEAEAQPVEGGEDEILDVTAAFDAGSDNEDLLDVTAAVGLEEAAVKEPEAAAEEEEDVLDITSGGDDDILDITSGAEQAADEEEAIGGDEDILDISRSGAEDLLDVTSAANLTPDTDEDLLDVTSASTAGADSDSLLDIDTGTSETSADEEDSSLDFDMEGLDLDISDESADEEIESASMIEKAMATEDDNVIDFDSASGKEDSGDDIETPEVELDLTMDTDTTDETSAAATDEDEISLDMGDDEGELSLDMETESMDAGTGEVPEISLDMEEDTGGADDLDLDLDLEIEDKSEPEQTDSEDSVPEIDMEGTVELPKDQLHMATGDDDDFDDEKTVFVPKSSTEQQSQEDEVSTKLDLAKAYVELGDSESAKSILDEIMEEGTEEQQQQAQELLKQI